MAYGNILVVDDDIELGNMLKELLEAEFFSVTCLTRGTEVLPELEKKHFDLILLDLILKDCDGFDILKEIRNKYQALPVIILSGKKQVHHKILGLGLGADDFVTKPFEEEELLARVKAHIRRALIYQQNQAVNKIIHYQQLRLDVNCLKLSVADQEIQLNTKIFRLIKMFMEQPERVFTKEQIYQNVWDDDYFDDNLVMIYISKLRKIIENPAKDPVYIKNVHGLGYKLTKDNI